MHAKTDMSAFGVEKAGGGHRAGLAPMLLGLLAPVLVLAIIDPRAITQSALILYIYMMALFVIAAAAFLISVFENGEITRAVVDRPGRQIILEKTGLFAKSELNVPFHEIAAIRMEGRYDRDGYETTIPLIVLSTRDVLPLPAGTTESDLATMRALIKARD